MLGGFVYWIINKPEKIEKVLEAINEFWRWQKVTKTFIDEDGEDWLRIAKVRLYKSADESLNIYDNYGNPFEYHQIEKFFSEEEQDQIREGKWILYWRRITWLYKWDTKIFSQLRKSCEKHDCIWFFDELIRYGDRSESILDLIKNKINIKNHELAFSGVPKENWK